MNLTNDCLRLERTCPLPNSHNRLRQFHDLWHEALEAYPDADRFTTKLNACIQTGRTVTFVLQKEHSKSERFGSWYEPWREQMRADPLMRWLVNARNQIEKQGDLETSSRAIITLASGSQEQRLMSLSVPPLLSPAQTAMALNTEKLGEEARRDAVIIVERRWSVEELPEHELLDVLSHCYGVLATIVSEAHARLGVAMHTFGGESHMGKHVRVRHPAGRLTCMVASAESRKAYWHLGEASLITMPLETIRSPERSGPEIVDHYGPSIGGHRIQPGIPLAEYAAASHQIGRIILAKDRCHHTFAWLFRGLEVIKAVLADSEDEQAKTVMIRRLAAEVDALGADAVVFSSELWTADEPEGSDPRHIVRPSRREDRGEAFATELLQRNGDHRLWLSCFTRDTEGRIVLAEALDVPTDHDSSMFFPILSVWESWSDGDV